ncbi:hypothetical protein ACIPM2_06515 [Streptomyces sp. NPDC086081]|uniref:hypothetical protein n=1 Tax=Streptomyces sp. NPDC086081 TaxID=3365749 RepID=UPI0038280879
MTGAVQGRVAQGHAVRGRAVRGRAVRGRAVRGHTARERPVRERPAQGHIARSPVTGGAIGTSGMDLVDPYPARVPNPRRAHRADLS